MPSVFFVPSVFCAYKAPQRVLIAPQRLEFLSFWFFKFFSSCGFVLLLLGKSVPSLWGGLGWGLSVLPLFFLAAKVRNVHCAFRMFWQLFSLKYAFLLYCVINHNYTHFLLFVILRIFLKKCYSVTVLQLFFFVFTIHKKLLIIL